MMKVNYLLIRIWFLGLVLVCQPAFSQAVASKEPIKTKEESKTNPHSLMAALNLLETNMDVTFFYESTLIANRTTAWDCGKQVALEKHLIELLVPNGLSYKKLSDRNYVITGKYRDKNQELEKYVSVSVSDGNTLNSVLDNFVFHAPNYIAPIKKYEDVIINGTVRDAENNEPLPGVNILIKGTTQGSVTDINGTYSITVPAENASLVFSFVGYEPQEIMVGNQTEINISLVISSEFLEEVVVTGYGTQNKKEITGSVASVQSEDFNRGNTYAAEQLIQGKVAGLTIARAGANPSRDYEIRLRGLSTTGPNSSPLVVVDGVIGVALNTVDPNDIESIDVLKDASASAIYGTRGASGVILVTTKKSKGKPRLEYNGYVSVESVSRDPEVMNRSEFLDFGGGTDLGDDVNWFEELTQTALSQYHNISLTGGSEGTSYRASFNYRDVEGIQKKTGWEQLNGRLNLRQKAINDNLTVDLNLAVTSRETNFGFDRVFQDAQIMNPTAPIQSTDPFYEPWDGYFQPLLFDVFNPVAINEQNSNEGTSLSLNWDIKGAYEIADKIVIDARYSQQILTETGNQYISKFSLWDGGENGRATKNSQRNKFELFESTATYNETFGQLDLRLLGGYSFQEFENEGFSSRNTDFISDLFTFNNLGAGQGIKNGFAGTSSFQNTSRLVAFFGRVNLNYNDTYFLTASLRREGSSMFGENEKWGNFPGVSAGVALNNVFDISQQTISSLKLRVSWGKTGNLPSDPYLSLVQLGVGDNFFFNGAFVPSTEPISNANPDLKWEEQTEFDIGVDFGFLNGKLTGTIDYYSRTTEGTLLFFPVKVPPNLFPNTWLNVGELKNSGIELGLNWSQLVSAGKFTYSAGITYTNYLSNDIVSLTTLDGESLGTRDIAELGAPQLGGINAIRIEEGKEIGNFWGFAFEGINTDGSWNFTDLNNDGEINDDDKTIIGNGLPKGEWGFNNSFTLGNWDLNLFFRGVFGHEIVNGQRAWYEIPNNISSYNLPRSTVDVKDLTEGSQYNSSQIESGSFFKLENASLGYNFDFPADNWISNLRLYFAGQNLFMVTDYKGVDPEVRFSDKDASDVQDLGVLAPGIDRRNTWARTYTISFGVNVGF